MLKVLLKKNFVELFRSYFYDAKRKKMRSKGAIAGFLIFYFVIIFGVLGGTFGFTAFALCGGLVEADMGWLYFVVMSMIALVLGTFGSVFSTFSSLYLAKDNDFLLSMPIPVRTIMVARLAGVYLMGLMYSAAVMIPTLIVYWIVAGVTFARVVGGILLFLIITVFILLLSVLLGWVVARISVKLKNKSIITVLISLLFLGLYYFIYFKAQDLIRSLIQNAAVYGDKIRASAYPLYLFGRVGEGDWLAAGIYTAAAAILFVLIWTLVSRSFIKVATATGSIAKKRYVEKTAHEKSAFRAFLGKEFKRFISSPNYMLNCGLSIIILPAMGIFMLFGGSLITDVMGDVFKMVPGMVPVLICAVILFLCAMTYTAAPSISLEGKSIWLPLSMPVDAKIPLRAKAMTQFILSAVPAVFAAVCSAIVLDVSILTRILMPLVVLAFCAFSALYSTSIGVRMPLLDWTNEAVPIKQGGAVTVVLFSTWGFVAVFGALYFFLGRFVSAEIYLGVFTVLYFLSALITFRWLDGKGAERFRNL
ncbi:MAG: hypothetical protein IK150_01795 [Lachnospiraceae bacterium]|nr:hypothetical protein [Lachnospiraceae bacterium]